MCRWLRLLAGPTFEVFQLDRASYMATFGQVEAPCPAREDGAGRGRLAVPHQDDQGRLGSLWGGGAFRHRLVNPSRTGGIDA